MHQCPFCDVSKENFNSLRKHATLKHKINSLDLYLKVFCNGVRPTCACGCGEFTHYGGAILGFDKWRRGHVSRVRNNWGHNPSALANSAATLHALAGTGYLIPWNKGKTKETNENIAVAGLACSATIRNNPDEIKNRSSRMRERRLSGSIPTLYGSAHPGWKGGTSSLQQLVRSRLFNAWNYPILAAAGFQCSICHDDTNPELNIHHDQERFATILEKAIIACDAYDIAEKSYELKSQIADWVVKYHLDNQISGICVCEECHIRLHNNE